MTVSDHATSFGLGAAVAAVATVGAVGAGAAVATVGAVGAVSAGAVVVGAGALVGAVFWGAVGVEAAGALVGAAEEPRSAIAGALSSVAAIAFAAAWHFGGQPAALPAAPVASAPVTTLIAEGKCKDIQTRFTGKDGTRVELILPPGCTLNPAP